MYKVYCNNDLLYNDMQESLKISDAKLTLELGKTGLFEFTIYADHVHYDSVVEMKAMVEVYRNDELIFYGRVLNIQYGFYNEKQVTCEGALAFLLDSLIPPHTYGSSFSGYLEYIVSIHNSQVEVDKQFEVGAVTVGDFSPFSVVENLEYVNALETLNKRMVERSGGYLSVRYEDGIRYLDLLSIGADIADVTAQSIRLGKNLIDIKRESNSEDVFSCIVPLGAKVDDTEIRLDVKNVNSGLPYIVNDDAVALYGKIYRQVIFDEITQAQTLKSTATNYLAENYAGISTIEITAADLSATGNSLDSFRIGQWVYVYDNMHFAETALTFLIRKMYINLQNPAENKIEIGKTKKGLTENVLGLSDSIKASSGNASSGNTGSAEVEVQQPYLMDSGRTGIWTWAIYSDNTCEFFGKIPVTGATITSALGNWYKSTALYDAYAYEYPFQMAEAPAVNMMFQTRNASGALVWCFSQDAATAQQYLPQCNLIRPVSGTNVTGNINIIGRGKL